MDRIHSKMMKTNKGIEILRVKDHSEGPILLRSQKSIADKLSFLMGALDYDPFFQEFGYLSIDIYTFLS